MNDLSVYLDNKRPKSEKIRSSLEGIAYTKAPSADRKLIQTVFEKAEKFLLRTAELNVASLSLEHVRDAVSRATWVDSIGNLIPLDESINNSIPANIPFGQKKSYYSKSRFKLVEDFLIINPQDTWEKEHMERWLDRLADLVDKSNAIR